MSIETKSFTSYMNGRNTATLTLTKGAVSTEYQPFGQDVAINLDEGTSITYIKLSDDGTIYDKVVAALTNNSYPIIQHSYAALDTRDHVITNRGNYTFTFANVAPELNKIYYLTVNHDNTYTKSEIEINDGAGGANEVLWSSDNLYTELETLVNDGIVPVVKYIGTDGYLWAVLEAFSRGTYMFTAVAGSTLYTFSINNVDKNVATTSLGGGFDLDANLVTEAPITKQKGTDGIITIGMNPREASPLSLIITPPVDTVDDVVSAASGGTVSGEQFKPCMSMHAFTIPNYFVIEDTDLMMFSNVNTQTDIRFLMLAIYRWDIDANALNLICCTDNIRNYVSSIIGFKQVPIGYKSDRPNYQIIQPYGIHYACVITDQSALQLAGKTSATIFNSNNPYICAHINNMDNCRSMQDLINNWSTINLATANVQEDMTRQAIGIRHVEE